MNWSTIVSTILKKNNDICDMINRNESDVEDIDFRDIGKERDQICWFDIVFSIDKLFITL